MQTRSERIVFDRIRSRKFRRFRAARKVRWAFLVRIAFCFSILVACSDAPVAVIDDDAGTDVHVAPVVDAQATVDVVAVDVAKEAAPVDTCGKHLTVLFAVGTGAGALKSLAGSCWSVLDADGSANKSFRKCSTSTFTVSNASAPNWAFDDTNPNASLTQDQDFLKQCSANATGDGFEYMAYRGSWRLLYPATNLRAFFAELYAGDGDVADYWPSAYTNNAQLANHTVYPMINIGPTSVSSPASTIEQVALATCKTIKDGGYFGVYVGTWNQPMSSTDARIVALASALDTCTKK